MISNYIIS